MSIVFRRASLFVMLFSSAVLAQTVKSVLPGFTLPKAESAYDQKLLDDVTKIGWHHVHVESEGKQPAFAFSLGFYANYGQPEIIVFGLEPETAQQLLNIAAIRIAGAKSKYDTYKAYDDIAQGMRIAFVPVAKQHLPEYFGYGRWFYQSQRGEFPALQMVWPDRRGRLPWEPGYDTRFSALQPLLDK
jgi:uncharacterized protein DUF4262